MHFPLVGYNKHVKSVFQEVFMLKMFSTQITGLFRKIAEEEEYQIEDAARLLSQAPAGDGFIYILGTAEMKGIAFEAVEGAEPLRYTKIISDPHLAAVSAADRVLLLSRSSTDEEAVRLAFLLAEKGVPFVSICSVLDEDDPGQLATLADVHINLHLTKGLLPDDEGNRYGFPSAMAALFIYHALKFTIDEIMAEYL
jgi:DNA-binding MurR/RpiR family transcriptional regulator